MRRERDMRRGDGRVSEEDAGDEEEEDVEGGKVVA